jgi:hypothetical protein
MLIDSLPLLPSLLVLMVRLRSRKNFYRLKSKVEYVVVERATKVTVKGSMWPPSFYNLSPEAQAAFKGRFYRAALPLPSFLI